MNPWALKEMRSIIAEYGWGSLVSVAIVVGFGVFYLSNPDLGTGEDAEALNMNVAHVDSSPKAMPLTISASRKFLAAPLEPLVKMGKDQIFPPNDLTKPPPKVEPAIEGDPRFESASFDSRVIKKIGYDYNLTVREVARNRKILESRPLASAAFLGIGENAAKYRDALLREELIDRETLEALNVAYPRDGGLLDHR